MTESEYAALKPGDIVKCGYEKYIVIDKRFDSCAIKSLKSSFIDSSVNKHIFITQFEVVYNIYDTSIKNKYWQNGNIFVTCGNEVAIVCNNLAFIKDRALSLADFNDDLINNNSNFNTIKSVFVCYKQNKENKSFNAFNIDELALNTTKLWERKIPKVNMTISEIENKLNLLPGQLHIAN